MNHPLDSIYTGAFSMALSVSTLSLSLFRHIALRYVQTVVSGSIQVIHTSWGWGGERYVHAIWGFWWLNVVVAFAVGFWVTHKM
jgi:hypothetical protein